MGILVAACTELAGASRGLLWTSEEKCWLHLALAQIFRSLCTLLPVSREKSKSLPGWSQSSSVQSDPNPKTGLCGERHNTCTSPLAGKQRTAALMTLSLLKPLDFKCFEEIEDKH